MYLALSRKTQITHSSRVCNRGAVVDGGDIRVSPHSRLRRQCGVIEVVTAPRLIFFLQRAQPRERLQIQIIRIQCHTPVLRGYAGDDM